MNYKNLFFAVTAVGNCIFIGCVAEMPTGGTTSEPRVTPSANVVTEKPPIPSAPEWTTNETAKFWASVERNATRITTVPRSGREADAEKGEGMLEAFGNQYMPNAYDNYEKVRAIAKEREQVFRENFPKGKDSDTSGGDLYQKIGAATAKAVSEYFRRRDELCHFYLMHKSGIMTAEDLAKLDEAPICTMLPAALPSVGALPTAPDSPTVPDSKALDFARKYMPETFAAYEKQSTLFGEGLKNFGEILVDARNLDAVRGGAVLSILQDRLFSLKTSLATIAKTLKEEKLMHDVGERSAEQLADADTKFGIKARSFEGEMSIKWFSTTWMNENLTNHYFEMVAHTEAPIFFLAHCMVQIPGKRYLLCKYPVTLGVWNTVMGKSPRSPFRYENMDSLVPVEDTNFEDACEFVKTLNTLSEVRDLGVQFRLPTLDELEMAVGSPESGGYKPMVGGIPITAGSLGDAMWYEDNANHKLHPIGLKKPNIYGIYDMLECAWTSSPYRNSYTRAIENDKRFSLGWDQGSRADLFVGPYARSRHGIDIDNTTDASRFMGIRLAW